MPADIAKVKRNVSKMVSLGAPEAEIDSYIASQGTDIETVRSYSLQGASRPTVLQNPTSSLTGWAKARREGAERVNVLRATRPNLMQQSLEDLKSGAIVPTNPQQALTRVGGVLQGEEEVLSRGLSDITQRAQGVDPKEGPSESGDIFRSLGIPENMAATLGMLTSGSMGVNKLAQTAIRKKVIQEGTSKVVTGSLKRATDFLEAEVHHVPQNAREYAKRTRYRFFEPGNLDDNAVSNTADEMVTLTRKYGKEPADSYYNVLKASGLYEQPVDPTLGPRLVDAIRPISDDLDSTLQQRVSTIDRSVNKRVVGRASKSSTPPTITVGDIIDIQRRIGSLGRKNPVAYRVSSELATILGEHYKPLAEAADRWRLYMNMSDVGERMWGKTEQVTRIGKGKAKTVAGRPSSMLDLFEGSGSTNLKNAPEEFGALLEQASNGIFRKDNIAARIRDVVLARHYKRGLPYLTAVSMAGGLAGAGGFFGLPGALIGGGMGAVIVGSSPQLVGKAKKLAYGAQGAVNTPNALRRRIIAERLVGPVTGQGITRQLTGRNE